MDTRNASLSRRSALTGGLALLEALWASGAIAQTANSSAPVPIAAGGRRLLDLYGSAPYTKEGRGPVLYVAMDQTCPFCRALWRDRAKYTRQVEFRWVPTPTFEGSSDQAVQTALARTMDTFDLYMTARLPAPRLTTEQRRMDVYNALVAMAMNAREIATENQARSGTPTHVWSRQGQTFQWTGYSPARMDEVVRRVAG